MRASKSRPFVPPEEADSGIERGAGPIKVTGIPRCAQPRAVASPTTPVPTTATPAEVTPVGTGTVDCSARVGIVDTVRLLATGAGAVLNSSTHGFARARTQNPGAPR